MQAVQISPQIVLQLHVCSIIPSMYKYIRKQTLELVLLQCYGTKGILFCMHLT